MDFLVTFIEETFSPDDDFVEYKEVNGYLDITGIADYHEFIDRYGKKHKNCTIYFKHDGTYKIVKVNYKQIFTWKQQAMELPIILPN